MKYGVLAACLICIPYTTAYAMLRDDTHATTPIIPDVIPQNITNKESNINLFLNVSVNSENTSDLTAVKKDNNGKLYILAKHLRALRIILDENISDTQLICLNDYKKIQFKYDESNQNLDLTVPQEMLTRFSLDLEGSNATPNQLLNLKPLNAAIINYSLYNTINDEQNVFSGSAEAFYSTRLGNFYTGVLYNGDDLNDYSHNKFVRLESKWQYINPIKIRLYTIGDFTSNTTDWGNSVRLGGAQWSSAYAQRSDIITTALPQFSGSAALPSTLDLYVNQQKVYSGIVPSGPFDIKQLPLISGNEVTLVTTDATGKQNLVKKAYYFSPKVLAKGVNQFSVDVGMPRYNYGSYSNDYDDGVLFGSGSIRYGIKQSLTLSGGMEASTDGLSNAGIGFAQNLWGLGVVNADFSLSNYKDENGYLSSIGLEGRINKDISFNTSFRKVFDNYYDLARVSKVRYENGYNKNEKDAEYNFLTSGALADELFRAGLSYNFYNGYGVYAGYNKIKSQESQYSLLSANFNANLGKNWNLYASVYKDFNDAKNYGSYIALRYTPSFKFNAITSMSRDADNTTSYRQEFNGLSGPEIGSLGWGGYVEHNERSSNNNASAYVNYRARPAYLTASYSRYSDIDQASLSATGSLVFAAGRVFAANEIGDGYAVVTNAGPKSQILNGGVNLGKTDHQGRFLISNLLPYQTHHIFLDPTYLPLQWEVPNTAQKVIVGYRQGAHIDFDAHQVISAVIKLVDKNNNPIQPGYSVTINGENTALIGYDGEVFVQGLLPKNILDVDLLDQGSCQVHFDYGSEHYSLKKLGPYVCQ